MNILFKTIFGSHLYCTNTHNSDMDFKGVFIAPLKDIILRKDRNTIHEDKKVSEGPRNNKDDIDIEYIELRTFIDHALEGQTYAIDMLFSNPDNTITYSPEWEFIIANRAKILSKNVKPFIGYIKKQTAKYGLKGSRLAELSRIIKYLEQFGRKEKIYEALEKVPFEMSEYITIVEQEHKFPKEDKVVIERYIKILEKMHPMKRFVGEVLDACNRYYDEYGERARIAMDNNGVDWKAVSHAYRACFQLIELANTGSINFPFTGEVLSRILTIKRGEMPYTFVQDDLPILMEKAIAAVENSTFLQDQPDKEFWDNFLYDTYIKYTIDKQSIDYISYISTIAI